MGLVSFEVASIFNIEDQASGVLATIAEQAKAAAASIAGLKEELSGLKGFGLGRLKTSIDGIAESAAKAKAAAEGIGGAFKGAAEGAAAAAAEIKTGFDAAFDSIVGRAKVAAEQIRGALATAGSGYSGGGYGGPTYEGTWNHSDPLLTYEENRYGVGSYAGQRIYGGGPPGGGPGSGGGGGLPAAAGSNGFTFGGGNGGIPINPQLGGPGAPGSPHFGITEMLEAGSVYEALKSSMDEELSIRRTELGLGLATSGPEEQAAAATLRQIARQSAEGTIYSERQTAAAMPVLAREFGFKGAEGLEKFGGIFPTALRSAEVAEMEHLGGLDDTLSANVEYAHMTGRYQPADLEKGLNTLQAIATATNQSPRGEQSILKYSVPIGIAAGIGADETAIATGFLQQQGFNSSTAGTGLSALILGALDTGGPMTGTQRARAKSAERELSSALKLTDEQRHTERAERHGTVHQDALRELGVTNAKGELVAVDDKGNLDLGKLEEDIYKYSQTHTHQKTLETLHGAFGTRGERVGAIYTNEGAIDRERNFQRGIVQTPGAQQQQGALADTSMQRFEQFLARSADLLNTLGAATLPAFDAALKASIPILTGGNAFLQSHPEDSQAAAVSGVGVFGGQLMRLASAASGTWVGRLLGLGNGAALGAAGSAVSGLGLAGLLTTAIHGAVEAGSDFVEDKIYGPGHAAAGRKWVTEHGPSTWGMYTPAAAATAAPTESTVKVAGGITVTVQAAPGAETGGIVAGIVNRLRDALSHAAGPGQGTLSSPHVFGGT